MRKPAFTVVSSIVVSLGLVGFAAMLIRPHIPTPIENELWAEESYFLKRAATQKIDWRRPTIESFARARRRDMPILLFVGNGYDPRCQALDQGVLMSPRIQALLARNFECFRVDTLEHPEFRNAFLPLSRYRVGIPSGFQIWVLDPSGKIVDSLPTMVGIFATDENLFARELVEARDRFASFGNAPNPLELAQRADIETLGVRGPLVAPPFAEYESSLARLASERGGFTEFGPRVHTPEAWRYLLGSGNEASFRLSIDPVLRSGAVDLIDGGFFHGSRDENWAEVDMSKSAELDANMLLLMSTASVLLGDPVYRYLAERTFDSLLDGFMTDGGFAAYRPSDQNAKQRSDRASFGVRKLLEVLNEPRDLDFAQTRLGLKVESNAQMIPRLESGETLGNPARLAEVLDKLRRSTSPAPATQGMGYMDVTGYCLARLMESARILGDSSRAERASSAFRLLEMGRRGDDVVHNVRRTSLDSNASDYLGYADAALQHYLATGRYDSIQHGRRVLIRCLERFGGDSLGSLNMADDREAPFPWTQSLPELIDPPAGSVTSQAIRLAADYSRVFEGETQLVRFASASAGKFGSMAFVLGERGAGFFNASVRVFASEFFVCVGPEAQRLSDEMARRHPLRLSIPAFGDVRADVQSRGPGVYVVRGLSINGPFDVDTAAKSLSPYLGAGP